MKIPFIIAYEKNCPLYELGEEFRLTDKSLVCPENREVCLILVRDMTQLLFQFMANLPFNYQDYQDKIYNCSGCSGLIKLRVRQDGTEDGKASQERRAVAPTSARIAALEAMARTCPLFEHLPDTELSRILPFFHEVTLAEGARLITRGMLNTNLYLVVTGELRVEDGSMRQALLGPGELCGEMSYLGSDVAVSSVSAVTETSLLAISGEDFGRLFDKNPLVQAYMAKLMAKRLRRTNAARATDFASCMSGRIDEIAPAELLQIFHMHKKSGVLLMEFTGGNARVSFREGCIINAMYTHRRNEEAIFAILAEGSGRYRFVTGLAPKEMEVAEIGDFMQLLMEGVKRVDETKE